MVHRQEITPRITHSDSRFLLCWDPPPIPRLALEHDLARSSCSMRTLEHHTFELWKERHEAHLKRAVLLSRMSMQLSMVLGAGISVDGTERVQLGVLDCPE